MAILFSNNAASTLLSGIDASQTSITIQVADAGEFPSPGGGDYFLATIQEGSTIEVVKCTARASNTLTVTRAQEGTSGQVFTTNATLQMRITKGTLESFLQTSATGAGPITLNGAPSTPGAGLVQIGEASGGFRIETDDSFRIGLGEVSGDIYTSGGGSTLTIEPDGDIISTVDLDFHTSSSSRWKINTSGHIIPTTHNTYDIGDGTTIPRSIFAAGGVFVRPGTAAGLNSRLGQATLDFQTLNVGTGANTNETILATYTLPANALSANFHRVRIRSMCITGANANNKNFRIRFGGIGGDILHATTSLALNAARVIFDVTIIRTGAANQDVWAQCHSTDALLLSRVDFNQFTRTLSSTQDIVVTGHNGTATANDCVCRGIEVTWSPE